MPSNRTRNTTSSPRPMRTSETKVEIDALLPATTKSDVVGEVKQTVVKAVESKLQNVSVEELASKGVERAREYARNEPALFFTGVTSLLVGAGLIAAAAKRNDEPELEIVDEESSI